MRIRRIAAIFFASLAAHALSFAIDLLFGALLGEYPDTAFLPSVTWSLLAGIGIWCASALWKSKWLAVPYAAIGLLAGFSGFIAKPLLEISVAGVMLLCSYFLWRQTTDNPMPRAPDTAQSPTLVGFPTADYELDGPVDDADELVEFSDLEYAVIKRQFKNQRNYNAPAIQFLGMTWNVMLGTVEGRIYKIAVYKESLARKEAVLAMADARQHCLERLAAPQSSNANLVIWTMAGGNVVLQRLGLPLFDEYTVNLFVTSSASRSFDRF